jgi:enoyl-CoA hydratase/carnithine racemase
MTRPGTLEDVQVDHRRGAVALVTINRPRRLNALAQRTRRDILSAMRSLGVDSAVGAVVLTGAGERAFAAGQDLAEAQDFDQESIDAWIDQWDELYDGVAGLGKPVIAAVNGYAVGAGLQLALVCDLRIAADNARFGMPEIDDAIPCITGTWALYEAIGRARTTELVLTGRMLDAREALQWGLVNRVVGRDQLIDVAVELAGALAAKPRTAMRLNKQWLHRCVMEDFAATKQFAKRAHREAFASGEPQAAMANFLAKRREGRSS